MSTAMWPLCKYKKQSQGQVALGISVLLHLLSSLGPLLRHTSVTPEKAPAEV